MYRGSGDVVNDVGVNQHLTGRSVMSLRVLSRQLHDTDLSILEAFNITQVKVIPGLTVKDQA